MIPPLIYCISMILIIDSRHGQVKLQSFDIGLQLADDGSQVVNLVIFALKRTLNLMKLFSQFLIFLGQLFNIVSQFLDNRLNRFMFFIQVVSQLAFSLFTFLLAQLGSFIELINIIFILLF